MRDAFGSVVPISDTWPHNPILGTPSASGATAIVGCLVFPVRLRGARLPAHTTTPLPLRRAVLARHPAINRPPGFRLGYLAWEPCGKPLLRGGRNPPAGLREQPPRRGCGIGDAPSAREARADPCSGFESLPRLDHPRPPFQSRYSSPALELSHKQPPQDPPPQAGCSASLLEDREVPPQETIVSESICARFSLSEKVFFASGNN